MSEQSGEKSFAPTSKRKQDAAKKGDVLRSKELGTAAAVLAGALCLILAGPGLFEALTQVARAAFSFDARELARFEPGRMLTDALAAILPPLLILGAVVMAATIASQLAFGEGRFLAANLAPKASRLDPLAGMKRMLGPQGWIELAKSLLKIGLLGTIAWVWGSKHVTAILGLGQGELTGQLAAAWDALTVLLLLLAAGLALIAMIDWPVQLVRRLARLKMTAQEMKDEHKEAEGSPEKRAAIRQRQRQMARGGVAGAMAKAQFVLTNPTHFSVAMAYDPALAEAPVVLAKGRGEKALAMRELASENGVPLLEYPALARSVYFTTRENQVIRAELYGAVASVLAFVLSLKRGEHPVRPGVIVPIELRFDAEGKPQRA